MIYMNIIGPITKKQYRLYSKQGKHILQQYIQFYKTNKFGGSSMSPESSNNDKEDKGWREGKEEIYFTDEKLEELGFNETQIEIFKNSSPQGKRNLFFISIKFNETKERNFQEYKNKLTIIW